MGTGPSGGGDRFPGTEEERALFTRSVETVLWLALAGNLLGAVCAWLLVRSPGSLVLLSLLLATVPLLAAFWLARRGWLRAAAVMVPIDALALVTVLLYTNDGLQDIVILAYPTIVAGAGLLLDRRSFVLITALAVASLGWIAWGEAHGLVRLVDPAHQSWIWGDAVIAAELVIATAVLVAAMVDGMRRSLADAVGRARELGESEARYRALFEATRQSELLAVRERTIADALIDSLPGMFFLIDRSGRFLRWNRRYRAELGYGNEEMARMDALETIAPQDRRRVAERMEACFRDGSADGEALALARDGRQIPHYLSGVRIELEGRSCLLGTAMDLSERARLQEQLYRSQKMEAIGSLAGGIAHDFNNILFAMSAVTELARRTVRDRPSVVAQLDQLLQSVSRARDLVSKILAFSRRTAPVVETVDLRTLAEEVSKLLRPSCPAGVRVRFSAVSEPVLVEADPSEVHQVILNLGANAAHAMSEAGGTIDISVGWAEPAAAGGPPLARLTVRDSGCGIPEHIRHRIFDPYFTTRPAGEGTGLGLSVVHGIVSRAGGHVEVDSVLGRGTRFDVLLAAVQTPVAAASATPGTGVPSPAGRGERLALVDDEPLVATVLAEALEELGYEVEVFVDSRAARRAIGSSRHYDLVITDEAMPHLGGLELARAVRECLPGQKFLLISAYPASLDARPSGGPELPRLAKPVSLQRLAEVIRRCLEGPPEAA